MMTVRADDVIVNYLSEHFRRVVKKMEKKWKKSVLCATELNWRWQEKKMNFVRFRKHYTKINIANEHTKVLYFSKSQNFHSTIFK
jgi:hypothetical protein